MQGSQRRPPHAEQGKLRAQRHSTRPTTGPGCPLGLWVHILCLLSTSPVVDIPECSSSSCDNTRLQDPGPHSFLSGRDAQHGLPAGGVRRGQKGRPGASAWALLWAGPTPRLRGSEAPARGQPCPLDSGRWRLLGSLQLLPSEHLTLSAALAVIQAPAHSLRESPVNIPPFPV